MTARFEYYAPCSMDESLSLLAQYGDDARVLAGGTDLLVKLRDGRGGAFGRVVNIKRIGGLGHLTMDTDGLHIGTLVTAASLMQSPVVQRRYPVLAQAAASMAGVQIRNLATVGGNLCNASPAADLATPLLALDAQVNIAGCRGARSIPLVAFFRGPSKTVLEPDELLTEIVVPPPQPGQRVVFLKLSPRGAMDISVVNLALSLTRSNGTCADLRLFMGAVGPTPLRAEQAESALRGAALNAAYVERAVQLAAEEARPIDDVRGSAWYRREMVEVLTRRAFQHLANGDAA